VAHQTGGGNHAPAFTLDGVKGIEATPGWSELVFDGPPDSAAKHGTVEVAVQNAPTEVVAQIVPYIKYRDTGEVFLLTGSYLFKESRAKVRPNLPNLKVTSITLNPNAGKEGNLTRGVITVVNESQQSFTQVPTKWVARRPDGSTLAEGVIRADYGPGEAKQLEISFVPDTGGNHRVAAMVNPDGNNPPNEVNFLNGDWPGDNRMEVAYQVAWEGVDVYVRISNETPSEVVRELSDEIPVIYVVGCAPGGPDAVGVNVTLTSGGSGAEYLTLKPGEEEESVFFVPMKNTGSHWFEVQAWPEGINDTNHSNNTDGKAISVVSMPLPEVTPELSDTKDVLVNECTDRYCR